MLWSLLAGLFALNFTFTVFIVALPKVAGEFHTSVTVLTWTMVGPLLAYGLAAPVGLISSFFLRSVPRRAQEARRAGR
jgi:MFS family permease